MRKVFGSFSLLVAMLLLSCTSQSNVFSDLGPMPEMDRDGRLLPPTEIQDEYDLYAAANSAGRRFLLPGSIEMRRAATFWHLQGDREPMRDIHVRMLPGPVAADDHWMDALADALGGNAYRSERYESDSYLQDYDDYHLYFDYELSVPHVAQIGEYIYRRHGARIALIFS